LDRRRKPPSWARRPLALLTGRPRDGAAVFVFADTFTNFYNPEIGIAAMELLEASGISAALAPNQCCGRPLISQGLLAEARALAGQNTETLHALAAAGRPILFLEPSCLSAMREDVPSLLRGDAQKKALRLAEACRSFEDYLTEEWESRHPAPRIKAGPSRILFHGHCHQKAMGLAEQAKLLLSRIPGAAVVDLDAGCCGMAGSFGYLRGHFDVSRAIGERRLLPAARSLEPGHVLVASGVSCRHQIEDFTGVKALHPAQLMHSLLAGHS
jgi:Fe-S oxidoreductase